MAHRILTNVKDAQDCNSVGVDAEEQEMASVPDPEHSGIKTIGTPANRFYCKRLYPLDEASDIVACLLRPMLTDRVIGYGVEVGVGLAAELNPQCAAAARRRALAGAYAG